MHRVWIIFSHTPSGFPNGGGGPNRGTWAACYYGGQWYSRAGRVRKRPGGGGDRFHLRESGFIPRKNPGKTFGGIQFMAHFLQPCFGPHAHQNAIIALFLDVDRRDASSKGCGAVRKPFKNLMATAGRSTRRNCETMHPGAKEVRGAEWTKLVAASRFSAARYPRGIATTYFFFLDTVASGGRGPRQTFYFPFTVGGAGIGPHTLGEECGRGPRLGFLQGGRDGQTRINSIKNSGAPAPPANSGKGEPQRGLISPRIGQPFSVFRQASGRGDSETAKKATFRKRARHWGRGPSPRGKAGNAGGLACTPGFLPGARTSGRRAT